METSCKIHSFQNQLDFSHSAESSAIWRQCYQQFFLNFAEMVDCRDNGDHQYKGIDRAVTLKNGKTFWIDEKVRRKDYGDILLEEWSNDQKSPGWIVKPLLCDFIAYAILPTGKAYLLPTFALQAAWARNATLWKSRYKKVLAHNRSWTTVSWAIPIAVLFPEIGKALRADFNPIQMAA